MSKKSTKSKAPKAPKATKAKQAKPDAAETLQIKKDAKGRFWVVAKGGGTEHGPYDTKQQATDAKAAIASGAVPAADEKPVKQAKQPKAKRVSAIDAAAQVLATATEAMNCQQLVEAMATAGLWESAAGKTPHATLYSAIIREIASKGAESRFKKADRGTFARAS